MLLDHAGEAEAAVALLEEAAQIDATDPVVRELHRQIEIEAGNWAVLADRALSALKEAEDDHSRVLAYEVLSWVDRDGREDLPSAVLGYESMVRIDAAPRATWCA